MDTLGRAIVDRRHRGLRVLRSRRRAGTGQAPEPYHAVKPDGPLRRVACERFPRTVGDVRPERDLPRATARYACLVVTSQFQGGVIAYLYRSKAVSREGAYAFCKVDGRQGVGRDPEVTTPTACGR